MVIVTQTGWLIGFVMSIMFWMMVVLWQKIEFMKLNMKVDKLNTKVDEIGKKR